MAAYAAVTSLKHTIHRLLNSGRISIVCSSQEILRFAYKDLKLLQGVVERLDTSSKRSSKRVKALEGHIREAACALEDKLEFYVSSEFLWQSENLAEDEGSPSMHSVDMVEPRQQLNFLAKVVMKSKRVNSALQKMLDTSTNSSERMKAFKGRIRKTKCRLEDVLESHVSDQFLSRPESSKVKRRYNLMRLQLDLKELRQCIHHFLWILKEMAEEYHILLHNPLPEGEEEEEDDAAVSPSMDIGGNKSEMVGLTEYIDYLTDQVVNWYTAQALSIIGMAGIGKTLLAKKIFENPLTLRKFDRRAFVRMGPKYRLNEILRAILAQVDPEGDKMLMEGDEKLYEYIHRSLKGRKYLIVLDDVWNADFWSDFRGRFPKVTNGSLILLTTRLEKVAKSIGSKFCYMRFLNKEESWDLLCGKAFAEEVCPPKLEKAGQKIAENCEGLPLLILTVADLLSRAEKTPEYWKKVAADKENSIFMDAYDQILKVLYPSYNYLTQHLKACFLYMGSFPQNHEVRRSKLINLWSAEGFLEPNPSQSFEDFAMECLGELVSSNLVLGCQWSKNSDRVKAYGLHSVFWHFCRKEAGNQKFLHALNGYADCFIEGIESQRRLAIYKNILFGIKDVYISMTSISTARSLLCTGAYHQYQVPICFSLRLLGVLDSLTIRFYEFPMEVLKLVQLRYLALTCNGNLPPSISKLQNLQYLIVYQHLSIKSTVAHSYLPVEIWDLKELTYLQIMGRNLPDPCGGVLQNLLTLLDVGGDSCTKSVFEGIPNLKKLRVRIELAPNSAQLLSCSDLVHHLYELESLQYVVVNPKFRSNITDLPFAPPSVYTSHLKKLTLSGFGYPWIFLRIIAKLQSLVVLQLQHHAFRGQKWEVEEEGFLELRYLLIDDTDLVQWTVEYGSFPYLRYLTIKNCYKLRGIPKISSLEEIRLVDCNPLVVICAKQMETNSRQVYADSSWDDGNLKS